MHPGHPVNIISLVLQNNTVYPHFLPTFPSFLHAYLIYVW